MRSDEAQIRELVSSCIEGSMAYAIAELPS